MPGRRRSFVVNSVNLLKQTYSEWLQDQAPQLGAALAYYTVFSLAPLVLLLLAIVGFLFQNDPAGAWKKITEQMSYFLDKSAIDVVQSVAQKASHRSSISPMLCGSSNAARTKGRPPWPACATASRTKAGNDAASTSRCWYAASSPYECAKPPAGNAESTNCQTSQFICSRPPSATKAPKTESIAARAAVRWPVPISALLRPR